VPTGFKDLWQKVAPTCGIDWATIAGTSTTTVRRPLPAYMGVIVVDAVRPVTSPGPSFSGHIVVVRTGSGYPDRGMVEAQVC
jgi:hypothetical protein